MDGIGLFANQLIEKGTVIAIDSPLDMVVERARTSSSEVSDQSSLPPTPLAWGSIRKTYAW